MGDEIDDDQRPAGAKDARHLLQRGAGLRRVVKDERRERRVDAGVLDGQVAEIGLHELDVLDRERLGPLARVLQHLFRDVDRDDALREFGEQGKHAPGAGPDVGHAKPARNERHQRPEARRLIEQLRADRVPAFRLPIEERLGLRAAARHDPLDPRQEPELGRAAFELGPDRTLEVAQRREVARHARLGGLHYLRELAHRELLRQERAKEAEARLVAERAKAADPVGGSQVLHICFYVHRSIYGPSVKPDRTGDRPFAEIRLERGRPA